MLKDKIKFLILFLIVSASFLIFRSQEGLVWNDSPQTAENLYDFYQGSSSTEGVKPICREEGASGLRLDNPNFWETITTRAFSCLEFGGYRPLSAFLSFVGVSIFSEVSDPLKNREYLGTIWMVFVASLFGFLATLLFSISKRFVESNFAAYLILLFFFFSPSMISGAWIMFSGGIQVTVPLFICLGLWIYFRTIESEKYKYLWTPLLIIFLLIGPLVREFIAVVALLIIFSELQLHRRPTLLMTFGIAGLLHAIFPTAIMHLLIHKLPLLVVFKLGSLSAQLNTAFNLKWRMLVAFALQLPPTLLIMALIYVLISFRKKLSNIPLNKIYFLIFWFLISFMPFLKVYSEHVHLAYALIPFLLLLTSFTEKLWIENLRPTLNFKNFLAIIILLVAVVDQLLNAYGSITAVKTMNSGIRYMADWFRAKTPKGSFVIANAPHAEDIRFYSRNHIIPYWSVGIGVPSERTLEKPEEIKAFLKNNFNLRPILMLNIDQEFATRKGNYHAHKYITRKIIESEPLGTIHTSMAHFPYLDPLRIVLPREMILFLGPPDLENDFYFGHDRKYRPFINEFYVEYSVYKVLNPHVSNAAYFQPDNTFFFPQYLKTYKEYKLYGYLDKFYAIKSDIPLKASNLQNALIGQTIEELEMHIIH